MRKFDYSFLNNGLLPANLVNLTSNITALKTMAGMRREEYTKIFTELEAVAKIQSIKSSNAIEGIVTSDERIAAIVNQNSAPLNHNEAEIAGYRDALNEIHSGYEHIDFRQRDILRLHEVMMGFTGYEYGGKLMLMGTAASASVQPLQVKLRKLWSSWSLPILTLGVTQTSISFC